MAKRLFEYLTVLVAVGLFVSAYFLYGKNLLTVAQSIIPNLFAVILAFLLLHFLFSRRGIDISDIVSGREARNKYRSQIVPAARRLEKAFQRNQEFFAYLGRLETFSNQTTGSQVIAYRYQVLSSDIFEAYMEAWVDIRSVDGILDPATKASGFIDQALDHVGFIEGKMRSDFSTDDTSTAHAALMVVKLDLEKTKEDLGQLV